MFCIAEDAITSNKYKTSYEYVDIQYMLIHGILLPQTLNPEKEKPWPHLRVPQVEGETYQLKPMNCPFHVEIYKNSYYSYRDLPLRWAELGTVYRYERSGAMQGLFRVRGFTQVRLGSI